MFRMIPTVILHSIIRIQYLDFFEMSVNRSSRALPNVVKA